MNSQLYHAKPPKVKPSSEKVETWKRPFSKVSKLKSEQITKRHENKNLTFWKFSFLIALEVVAASLKNGRCNCLRAVTGLISAAASPIEATPGLRQVIIVLDLLLG